MKIATSTESRAEERDVYRPASSELGMAHRSYLSPDHKWVLAVEMDPRGWLPCAWFLSMEVRLASRWACSQQVHQCGVVARRNWMYFSADTGSGFHIWRQRFPMETWTRLLLPPPKKKESFWLLMDGPSSLRWALNRALCGSMSLVEIADYFGGYAYTPTVSPDGARFITWCAPVPPEHSCTGIVGV